MSIEEIGDIRKDIKEISESHNHLKGKYIEISGRLIASEDLNAERYKNLSEKMDRLLDYQKTQNGNVARVKLDFEKHKEDNNKEMNNIGDKIHLLDKEFAPMRSVLKRPTLWLLMVAVLVVMITYTMNTYIVPTKSISVSQTDTISTK